MISITCPCLVPIIYDGIEWYPEDWKDDKAISIEPVTEKGKKYMIVLFRKPEGHKLKEYTINGHLAYAGCAELKDGKLKCEHKSLFYVLHPEKEWKEYHEIP